MARRTAGSNGASWPMMDRHRISFNSKSSIRSYSVKSIQRQARQEPRSPMETLDILLIASLAAWTAGKSRPTSMPIMDPTFLFVNWHLGQNETLQLHVSINCSSRLQQSQQVGFPNTGTPTRSVGGWIYDRIGKNDIWESPTPQSRNENCKLDRSWRGTLP